MAINSSMDAHLKLARMPATPMQQRRTALSEMSIRRGLEMRFEPETPLKSPGRPAQMPATPRQYRREVRSETPITVRPVAVATPKQYRRELRSETPVTVRPLFVAEHQSPWRPDTSPARCQEWCSARILPFGQVVPMRATACAKTPQRVPSTAMVTPREKLDTPRGKVKSEPRQLRSRSPVTVFTSDCNCNGSPAKEDPFNLRRFTQEQKQVFQQALREIRSGRKVSGWMWFVIPTPPHIVAGADRGSAINRRFALRSDDEAIAYLSFEADGVNLRQNYIDMLFAVLDQLRAGRNSVSLFGKMSAPKLESSLLFLERISSIDNGRGGKLDEEVHDIICEVLWQLGK